MLETELQHRILMHLDLNAFFAAVEEREHPEHAGKPIVVGSDPKAGAGRGVVATANYEARKYGIKSAMPISRAYRACPTAVFLPVNYPLYAQVSARVMALLRRFAPKIEQVSIDEAYMDVSHVQTYDAAEQLAKQIKQALWDQERLKCSVGIGPNKLIAKAGSDFQKPDGLTIIPPEKVLDFLAPQDVSVLRGVGVKTKEVLHNAGLKTVEDVRNRSQAELTSLFGSFGQSLYLQSLGNGPTELVEDWEAKSIGRQSTFEQDTDDPDKALVLLYELIDDVHGQLKRDNLRCKTITVKVRYEDFVTRTKQRNLIDHSDSLQAIQTVARDLLKKFLNDERKIRLVGISVRDLK